jgi:hypothetical protein
MPRVSSRDPNIVVVQEITGTQLSVSDYANHEYIPEPNWLTPEEIRLSHAILWGDNSAAALDSPIAAGIAALAQASSSRTDVRAARSIQLSDLKTDDNFIFLGSPRSDPWSALFDNELDFRFAFRRRYKTGSHSQDPSASARVPDLRSHGSDQQSAWVH